MRIQFFLQMVPPTITAQEKDIRVVQKNITRSDGKVVRKPVPVVYEDQKLKDARQKLMGHLARWKYDSQFQGMPPGKGVRLETVWCFKLPTSGTSAGVSVEDGDYRLTKPDTDNLQKMLKDCMTATGFWKDDALVCSEQVEKRWASTPGIFITVEDVESFTLREAGFTDQQIEDIQNGGGGDDGSDQSYVFLDMLDEMSRAGK